MSRISERTETATSSLARSPAGQLIDEFLAAGASAWRLSRSAVVTILVMPAVVAASGVAAAFMGKAVYKRLTEEDQIAEVMQVGFYGSALIMSLIVAHLSARMQQRLIAVLFVILAGGLFFLVGEEVSWGQRIIGWGTPQSLAAINKQEETNLHNIYGVGATFKWVQMLVGAYGTFLPFVFLRPAWFAPIRRLVEAVVPHYTLIPYFLPMFAWRLYRNLAGDPDRYYYVITNYNEIIELILSMGFCLFLVFQLRKSLRERDAMAARG